MFPRSRRIFHGRYNRPAPRGDELLEASGWTPPRTGVTGRQAEFSLTRDGTALLARSIVAARENQAHFAARLTAAEAGDLKRLLDKLVEGETRSIKKL